MGNIYVHYQKKKNMIYFNDVSDILFIHLYSFFFL